MFTTPRPDSGCVYRFYRTCLSVCLYCSREFTFGVQVHRGIRVGLYMSTKVIGLRLRSHKQKSGKCHSATPGLSESMTATAVTASPFQSFRSGEVCAELCKLKHGEYCQSLSYVHNVVFITIQ